MQHCCIICTFVKYYKNMKAKTFEKNYQIGKHPMVLEKIHNREINIAIYDRDVENLKKEIGNLLSENINFRVNGEKDDILDSLTKVLTPEFNLMFEDIKFQLNLFGTISKANSFKLSLSTVNTNMCRKFHSDINDLRLLCTYSGPGTLWLEDNIDVESDKREESIDLTKINQADTGSILILKGSIYPNEETKPIIHRSPSIEEDVEKRLLLRIDTNIFLNF